MKKWILGFALFFLVATLCAQQSTQTEAIRKALENIAKKNALIENIIYDGMTYSEVAKILGEVFSIQINMADTDNFLKGYLGISFHGNYAILWSSNDRLANPIVLGFRRLDENIIRHNKL